MAGPPVALRLLVALRREDFQPWPVQQRARSRRLRAVVSGAQFLPACAATDRFGCQPPTFRLARQPCTFVGLSIGVCACRTGAATLLGRAERALERLVIQLELSDRLARSASWLMLASFSGEPILDLLEIGLERHLALTGQPFVQRSARSSAC